jgi:cysteinyl-tRNA synthetase
VERISELPETAPTEGIAYEEIDVCEKRFYEAMEDDFNTAVALSAIFDLSTALNRLMDDGNTGMRPTIVRGGKVLVKLANLLGLLSDNVEQFLHDETLRHLSSLGIDEHTVDEMVKARTEARKNRDFAKSDEIRRDLLEKGILLLDTPGGTKWRIKK